MVGDGERGGGQISEYVVSVSAVLETTGVDQTARQRVMGVKMVMPGPHGPPVSDKHCFLDTFTSLS